MACFYLMREQLDCAIWIDTGYAYPETEGLVRYVADFMPVHAVRIDRDTQQQSQGIPADVVPVDWTQIGQLLTGPKNCTIQPYLDCCFANISLPILTKAKELGVVELVSGERKDEAKKSASRDGEVAAGIIRRHPIHDWTEGQVLAYLQTQMGKLPEHFRIKHSSLDCYDCTGYKKDSQDRVEYTAQHHPMFFQAYRRKRDLLDAALKEALSG